MVRLGIAAVTSPEVSARPRDLLRRAGLLVAGLTIVVIVAAPLIIARLRPPEYLVFDMNMPGESVGTDDDLDAMMSGSVQPEPEVIVGAYCLNRRLWQQDRSLDLDLVVVTAESWYRVAELVVGGEFEPSLIADVERELQSSGAITSADVSAAAEPHGSALVEEYLSARHLLARDESLSRFVIWVSNSTMSNQVVWIADRTVFDRSAGASSLRRPRLLRDGGEVVRVAGHGSVRVDKGDCGSTDWLSTAVGSTADVTNVTVGRIRVLTR